ncbi:MAG: hypothetical protein AB7S26_06495 [Sandaracinaceae bacterium]
MSEDIEAEDLAKIEEARRAVSDARQNLDELVRLNPAVLRAKKVLISEATRAAFVRLRAARAKLSCLSSKQYRLAVREAEEAIARGERHLDRLIRSEAAVVGVGDDDRWVSESVELAFADLRAARGILTELIERPGGAEPFSKE